MQAARKTFPEPASTTHSAGAMAAGTDAAARDLLKRKASIKDAFLLFGKEETMTIHDEDVATVLRYLGLYPTTADLVDKILPEMQGDTPGKYVAFEQFEERVLDYQELGLFVPDSEEQLLQAFRVSFTRNASSNATLPQKPHGADAGP